MNTFTAYISKRSLASLAFAIYAVLCIGLPHIHAQNATTTLKVDADESYYDKGEHLALMPDTAVNWQLIDAEHAFKKKQPFNFQNIPAGYSTYWGKISLEVSSAQHRIIGIGQAQSIQIWVVKDGQVIQQLHTGSWIPLKERSVQNTRLPIAQVHFPKAGVYDIYIRWNFIKPQVMHRINFFTYPLEQWNKDNGNLKVLQGLFQGVMLIFFLYNLAKFFTNRDKTFLYYSFFVFSFDSYNLFYYGLGLEYIYSNYPKIEDYVWLFSTHLASIFYILFAKSFCGINIYYPRAWKWIKVYLAIKLIHLFGVILLLNIYADYALLDITQRSIFLLEEILFLIFMVWLWRQGNPVHQYLVVGTIIFSTTIALTTLAPELWTWNPYYYPLLMQVGALLKIFIFSMGLGYKQRLATIAQRKLQEELIIQLQENERLQEQINKELELKVQERTAELENKKEEVLEQHRNIEAQNRQLRILNEEQDNLMKIVAHDLKSPLNRIEGVLSIFKLSMQEKANAYEDYFNIIQQSIAGQKTLISRVLNSENAKGVSIHIERLNLTDTLGSLARLFKSSAESKHIELIASIPKKEIICYTDDTLINAIVENLLSNAIKFSPPNKRIWLTLNEEEQGVVITIADEGPGFTEEDQKKMFARYQKLSAQPTGNEDSTGLGLSIVKQYMEVLGGELTCETAEGQGARFVLRLGGDEKNNA